LTAGFDQLTRVDQFDSVEVQWLFISFPVLRFSSFTICNSVETMVAIGGGAIRWRRWIPTQFLFEDGGEAAVVMA